MSDATRRPADTVRHRLRRSTQSLHDQVDREAEHHDLTMPAGLTGFLLMMARGLEAVEGGLDLDNVHTIYPEWPTRKRLHLVHEDLGGKPCHSPRPPLRFASHAEMWGALYVLEGSRLGSRLLGQRAPDSIFLQASSRDTAWPDFLLKLESAHARLDAFDEMVAGAGKAFAAFSETLQKKHDTDD